MLHEESALVHGMIEYFYTLGYLVSHLFSPPDSSNSSEAPSANASEAHDVFADEM